MDLKVLYFFRLIWFCSVYEFPSCMYVPGAGEDQKRVLDPLEVELQITVSSYGDTRN